MAEEPQSTASRRRINPAAFFRPPGSGMSKPQDFAANRSSDDRPVSPAVRAVPATPATPTAADNYKAAIREILTVTPIRRA